MGSQDRTVYNEYIEKLKLQLIIPIEQITATSALDLNIDEDKLIFACVNSQKIYLEPLIGSAMIRKLQSTNITFEYQILLEKFMNDAIINWGVSECIQGIVYSLSNGGVYKHTSTDSETPSSGEISALRQSYLNKADLFARRMVTFLNKNYTYYPEYNLNSPDGLNSTKKTIYTGGLLIEEMGYEDCGGGVGNSDPELFIAETYWGNSDESLITFDYTLLSSESNVLPLYVTAQPTNNYFWIVSTTDFDLSQVGIPIPTVPFDDPGVDDAIFVKGVEGGRTYIRIKIIEVYENSVTFQINL